MQTDRYDVGPGGLDRFFELYLFLVNIQPHLALYFLCDLFGGHGSKRFSALSHLNGHPDPAGLDLLAKLDRRLVLLLGNFVVIGLFKLQVI